MAERVLITGGAGYLGSVLCERLLAGGYRVRVLDNLMYGQRSLFAFCHNPDFEFVFGDVRDRDTLRRQVADSDVIIPLAALVGAPACDRDPWLAESVNLGAIRQLNEVRSAQQRVVYPNTNSGYGIGDTGVACTEDSPLRPISLYGRTKVEAEQALLDSPNVVTFRLATVFGMSPRMRLDLLVNDFVYTALNQRALVLFEAHFKRNYIHIRDVADAFVHAIENFPAMAGRCYNAGLDDANLSKAELAELIRSFLPEVDIHHAEIGQDPDKRDYIVSNQRLREAGFVARRGLEQGITELLKGYAMMRRQEFRNV